MVRERWGTFSVIDHRNVSALATDILLYDRLVNPTPPKNMEVKKNLIQMNYKDGMIKGMSQNS
jgi:hypothetical protein